MICGTDAGFWGSSGEEQLLIDKAIGWVHKVMRVHEIPCFRGLPFWTDLLPVRKINKAMNTDPWHHSDQNSGKMAYAFDRYFTHMVCLLQLTRLRSDNKEMMLRLFQEPFEAPQDSLKRTSHSARRWPWA